MRLAIAFALLASPLVAGVPEVLDDHLLPGFDGFTQATRTLDDLARTNCTAEVLRGPYNAAFDAFTAIADMRLGPSEAGILSIYFWPDKRGFTQGKLSQWIADKDPIVAEPATFSQASVAGRGLFALERMLYDPEFTDYDEGSYSCTLTRALTKDLAQQAHTLEEAWRDGFAATLLNPGTDGNTTYLDEDEALRAVYTQILHGVQLTADTRLGRPLGDVTRPRPTRAEAWRSGRSLPNAVLYTKAAVHMAHALADWDLPETEAALTRVFEAAAAIEDPSFQDIDDLANRFKVEVLAQEITSVAQAIETEIGAQLGIMPGFNASDGD